jgi:hypothetical protein
MPGEITEQSMIKRLRLPRKTENKLESAPEDRWSSCENQENNMQGFD